MKVRNEHIILFMLVVCAALLGYFVYIVMELFGYDLSVFRFSFDRIEAPWLPRY